MPKRALLWVGLLVLVAGSARAELFTMSASGTITANSSPDTTIPAGTPWEFQVIYETSAPDLDFELTGMPDPSFGRFTNTGNPPAVVFFHYRAGSYEVTLDDPGDFGPFSAIDITFTSGIHAIDINLNSALFPPLAGGPVSFHADFNDATHSALTSDALPANTALGLQSFQEGSVTLLPPSGAVLGSTDDMTSLKLVAGFDRDADGIVDATDDCPFFPDIDQTDTDHDGRGNACECTDQNGDGRNTVSDLVAINTAIFNPAVATPLCDGNNDGLCNVSDIVAANVEIFSPTSTSTCARQPVPGP